MKPLELLMPSLDQITDRMSAQFTRSWGQQPVFSRRMRMDYVLKMALELDAIRKRNGFATMWAEAAIAAVIMGTPEELREYAEMLTFSHEDEVTRDRHAGRFTAFREICAEAVVALEGIEQSIIATAMGKKPS